MKKLISLVLICLAVATTCLAQDCKMCGTWIGIYSTPMGKNIKIYVRVKQHDNHFSVRVKTIPIIEPENINYWNECIVNNATDNTITFMSFSGDELDWTSDSKINGKKIARASYWMVCTITYNHGELIFTDGQYIKYWGIDDSLIGEQTIPSSVSIALYKDDDDW